MLYDQSGKYEQPTGWKNLLTSEMARQLRAARPLCGTGTLIKIIEIARSQDHQLSSIEFPVEYNRNRGSSLIVDS